MCRYNETHGLAAAAAGRGPHDRDGEDTQGYGDDGFESADDDAVAAEAGAYTRPLFSSN